MGYGISFSTLCDRSRSSRATYWIDEGDDHSENSPSNALQTEMQEDARGIPISFSSGFHKGVRVSPRSEGGGAPFKFWDGPFSDRWVGGGTRSQIYGDMRYGSGYPSGAPFKFPFLRAFYHVYPSRPVSVSGGPFPFGFLPISMPSPYLNSSDEYATSVQGLSRPGGDMSAQFVVSKPLGPDAGRFYLIGDASSVSFAHAALIDSCNATNLNEPFTKLTYPTPEGTDTTHYPDATEIIQFYRASSFALALSGFNASALPDGTVSAIAALPSSVDRAFLECINSTIASTIPILDPLPMFRLEKYIINSIIIGGVIAVLLFGLTWCWTPLSAMGLRGLQRLSRPWRKKENADQPDSPMQTPAVDTEASQLQSLLSKIRIAIIMVLVVGSIVLAVLIGRRFLVRNNLAGSTEIRSVNASAEDGIFLKGTVHHFDMDAKTLSLQFFPVLCNPSGMNCRKSLENDLFFFHDIYALGDGGFNESDAILKFRTKWQGIDIYQTIDMNVLEYPEAGGFTGADTNANYPWDWYYMKMVIAATQADLVTTTPILGARLFNAMQNGWKFKLVISYIYIDSQAAKLNLLITIGRTSSTQVAAMLIVTLNWIVTLGILWITLMYGTTSYRFLEGQETIGLPFAALFALPSIRAVMPGEPPLGCFIDFAGIIPNLAICSVCATCHLVSRIRAEARKKDL